MANRIAAVDTDADERSRLVEPVDRGQS